MIIYLGLLDILTVFLTLSAVYTGYFTNAALVLLLLLGLKGAWTLFTIKKLDPLGALDLITAVTGYLLITQDLYPNVAIFCLTLTGLKGLTSIIRF
jgi:hypothetical protein